MKAKVSTVLSLMSLLLLLIAGNAFAGIASGSCVDCHTMHNSQSGASMQYDGSATPSAALLRAGTCGGCHADGVQVNATTANKLTNLVPQVNPETNTLAGGSFFWVESGTDIQGHSVADLGITDTSTTPPGFNGTRATEAGLASTWTGQLTCAGAMGCHGDHAASGGQFGAIRGAHHEVNLAVTGASVGTSYRFLNGIVGYEDPDYELSTSDTDHNVYKGVARTAGVTDTTTISYLCSECHGDFHTDAGIADGALSSPWIRHPTDIQMRSLTTEAKDYAYTVEAPAAVASPAAPTATTYDTDAVVTCVSCHRAHGSSNDYLLRWTYSTMVAGTTDAGVAGTGCFACHLTKDGI